MDNVVSIYTRKTPCDNLFIDKEQFTAFYLSCIESGKENHDSHIDICSDCSQRYFVENREQLTDRITMFLATLTKNLENPNA